MNQNTNTQTITQQDMVVQDFKVAVVVVSLVTNLAIFTTWLVLMVA